jgi:4-hydroxy-3-methylbut-2-enyl diphosphate reductase
MLTGSHDLVLTRERGRVTFKLAAERGFCYGVERAIRMALETIEAYPEKRTLITSEILHNPRINDELRERGVLFLSHSPHLWNDLSSKDVVLLPAFGAPLDVRARLEQAGALVVDTTCGSVAYVWKNVDRFARDGFTLVYHGRRGHEEAVATLSRLQRGAGFHPYFVLQDRKEAEPLIDFLESRISSRELLRSLPHAGSPAFDPDKDLVRFGFSSQTTMLARETLEIGKALKKAQARRFGEALLPERFRMQDTICAATQDRQDAVEELLDEDLDLVLVVGGYASSNSAHLAELASEDLAAYHVEGPEDILSASEIRHKAPASTRPAVTANWLPAGPVVIGITSGASTPEQSLEGVMERVSAVASG